MSLIIIWFNGIRHLDSQADFPERPDDKVFIMIKDKRNNAGEPGTQDHTGHSKEKECKILVTENGPYLVAGGLPLAKEIIITDDEGTSVEWGKGDQYPAQETYALCRCGQSKNKPFCDGTHAKAGFDGTETASTEKYLDQAETIAGPGIILTDAQDLCAAARFCHLSDGAWNLTEESDDPVAKENVIKIAARCPSGRLVAWDKKTGKPIEPEFDKSVSLVEDPEEGVSGPIWAKGGIPIESSDGTKYEVRNRVTLCRCGKSYNKPFCDGTHIDAGFNDGDRSVNR